MQRASAALWRRHLSCILVYLAGEVCLAVSLVATIFPEKKMCPTRPCLGRYITSTEGSCQLSEQLEMNFRNATKSFPSHVLQAGPQLIVAFQSSFGLNAKDNKPY